MDNLVRPEIIPVIEGLKPYLGSGGKPLAEALISFFNAITSEPIKQAMQAVSNVLPRKTKRITDVKVKTVSPTANFIQSLFANNFSLILFLILILLFSGD